MRCALVDADFLPYYCCHNKKGEEPKTLQQCYDHADQFIHNIFKATKATHYIMAWTVGKCFRYNINPQYKANRKYTDVIPFLDKTKTYLRDKYNGAYDSDLEADDIINICRKHYLENTIKDQEPSQIFFVSPDKDILMLEGTHFNPKKMMWVTTSRVEADEFFWISTIKGDTIDGVKGIPGKGEVFAKKLFKSEIQGFIYEYASLVFNSYLEYFGEHRGVEEFYKNYKCLKIADSWRSFKIPEPIKIEEEVISKESE